MMTQVLSSCHEMSDPEANALSDIWARWFEAYSRLRQLPVEPMEHGWWIDVGKSQQSGRYILREGDVALLGKLAEAITDPAVHFELPTPLCLTEQVLPLGWALAAPEFLMTLEVAAVRAPVLPAGYQILLDIDDAEIRASCVDEGGHPLSRGVCVVIGADAIFDQVVTELAARRQGLASVIMAVLTEVAVKRGALRGILLATAEGRPFYEALGWRVLSEVSKAVSPAESRAARHLRIVSRH